MKQLRVRQPGTLRQRNTDTQRAPHQPGSHEPGHKAGRKEAREYSQSKAKKRQPANIAAN
jgi:hypothetical protein